MQITLNIATSFSVFLLIALSFSIVYFTTKKFHIAHAAVITLSAFFAYLFIKQVVLPFSLSITLALLFATILGILSGYPLYVTLQKRKSPTFVFLIASLGIYIILQNLISIIWGDEAKSINIEPVKEGIIFFGGNITKIQIMTIMVSLFSLLAWLLYSNRSNLGRQIRAVSSNDELAKILGIKSKVIVLLSFTIGSVLAAVTGILVALNTNITPTMGFNLLLYGIVAMIIGGVGSTWGLIGGSLLLATAQHLSVYYIGNKWMDVIVYIILILFLIWKPLGFSGKRLKKIEI